MSRNFEARYPGRCALGDDIEPGDMLRYNADDEVEHVTCDATSDLDVRPGETVCPDCFLIHPEGVCSA